MNSPSEVYVSVYGGLRVVRPHIDLVSRPPRERLILAMLVAGRGAVVSMNDFVDALWEIDPPMTALNQVQRHIGELRRLLQPGLPARMSGSLILASGEGYRVDTQRVDSDLEQVSRLVAEAQAAAPTTAVSIYAQALRLASPPPFVGLPWSALNRPEFSAVQRNRVALALEAADFTLEHGDPLVIIEEIEQVAADAPLDERLQERLVRMLGRVGRRADAIAVFEATRTALQAELGIEPGEALQAARSDAVTDHTVAASANASVPRKLPPSPASLVQRKDSSGLLDEALEYTVAGGSGLLAVSGMAGIGKTTLAINWARSVAHRFPDGELFVNLQGFGDERSVVSTIDALGRMLEDLGVSLADIGADERSRGERFRREMSTRRMIVVLDNAADADRARALLPGSSGTLVIVTSRRQLTSLVVRDGAIAVPLWRWSDDESRELLTKRLGTSRASAIGAQGAIDSIVRSCAGLPLALAMAAAASASTPGADSGVQAIADRLAATASALDTLSLDRDDDLRSAFTWSYELLSPNAARVFRLASMHPGAGMSLRSLASISKLDLKATSDALFELTAASMMVVVAHERWGIHDLLRLFGNELAGREGETELAQTRLLDHFVHSARRASQSFGFPPVAELRTDPPVAEAVEEFESSAQAIGWFVLERQALVATFEVALSLGLDRQAALLATDWVGMIQTVEPFQTIAPLTQLAHSAAVRAEETDLRLELLFLLGAQLCFIGEFEEGMARLSEAYDEYAARDDAVGECQSLRNMALFERDLVVGRDYADRAIAAARKSGRQYLLVIALLNFLHPPSTPAEVEQRFASATEAMTIVDESHLDFLRGYALANLALAHHYRGNYEMALELCAQAVGALAWRVDILRLSIVAAAAAGIGRRQLVIDTCADFDRQRSGNPAAFETSAVDIEMAINRIEAARLTIV